MSISAVPISGHIDPFFSNRLLDIKINLFNSLSRLKLFFSINGLYNSMIRTVNKDLSKVFITLEGLKTVISNFDHSEAREEHPIIEKAVQRFNRLYIKLEQIEFFGNAENKQLAEAILGDLYFLEFTLRKKAFAAADATSPLDVSLKDKASTISLNTLSGISNESVL
jgi:hypothetical protein